MTDPFRSVIDAQGLSDVCPMVIGYRQTFCDPVSTAAVSEWFCFHFHDRAVITVAGVEYICEPNSFIISAPGDPAFHRGVGPTFLRSWMRLAGPGVRRLVARAGLHAGVIYQLADDSPIDEWLLAVHRECFHPLGIHAGLLVGAVELWLHAIQRSSNSVRLDLRPIPARVWQLRRWIEAHYREHVSLTDMAAQVGTSISQLGRDFRTYLQTSPQQMVIRLRCEHAADLLQTTSMRLEDIAEISGFCDRYYLTRVFRRQFGCTPAQFRKGGMTKD